MHWILGTFEIVVSFGFLKQDKKSRIAKYIHLLQALVACHLLLKSIVMEKENIEIHS